MMLYVEGEREFQCGNVVAALAHVLRMQDQSYQWLEKVEGHV